MRYERTGHIGTADTRTQRRSASARAPREGAKRCALLALAVAGACAAAEPARAQVTGFTSRAAFLAALPGAATVLAFEGFAPGALLPSGSGLGAGVSVAYAIGDGAGGFLTLAVVDRFATTSGTRSLGLADPANEDQLVLGDELDFAVAGATQAFGLSLISSDALFAGDVRLVTAQGEAANGATAETTLPDGGLVYFVGLVAPAPVAQVSLRYGPGAAGAALFALDDVTLVPEPGAGGVAVAVTGALAALRLRHRHRKETP